MNIKIKSRFDDRILYECKADTMLKALQKALKAKADLSSANLSYADLSYANIDGNPVLDIIQVSGIGSIRRNTTAIILADSIIVTCGCFRGAIDEWKAKIEKTHANAPKFLAQYRAAIAFIEACVTEARKSAQFVTTEKP